MAEVTLRTKLGLGIYTHVSNTNLGNIVEIGGWDGKGSTWCVVKALKDTDNKITQVFSVELQKHRHDLAKAFYKNDIIDGFRICLINGSVVGVEEAVRYTNEHLSEFKVQQRHNFGSFYAENISSMKGSVNVSSQLPQHIDFLILDGGEYSTYAEWRLLQNRVRYIALDDDRMLKCKYVKQEILARPHKILLDTSDRNGGFIAELL